MIIKRAGRKQDNRYRKKNEDVVLKRTTEMARWILSWTPEVGQSQHTIVTDGGQDSHRTVSPKKKKQKEEYQKQQIRDLREITSNKHF